MPHWCIVVTFRFKLRAEYAEWWGWRLYGKFFSMCFCPVNETKRNHGVYVQRERGHRLVPACLSVTLSICIIQNQFSSNWNCQPFIEFEASPYTINFACFCPPLFPKVRFGFIFSKSNIYGCCFVHTIFHHIRLRIRLRANCYLFISGAGKCVHTKWFWLLLVWVDPSKSIRDVRNDGSEAGKKNFINTFIIPWINGN